MYLARQVVKERIDGGRASARRRHSEAGAGGDRPREVFHYLVTGGLTLSNVVAALERNNANAGGGAIIAAGESTLVQGIGVITRKRDIEDVVIAAKNGIPVRVRDVAKVVEGHEIRRGAVTADGKGEAVLGLGFMLIGEAASEPPGAARRSPRVRMCALVGSGVLAVLLLVAFSFSWVGRLSSVEG